MSTHDKRGDDPAYGFPRPLWRALAKLPAPVSPRAWGSPLRGPWLTSLLGATLLVLLPVVIVTGLLSYIAYAPQLGQAMPSDVGFLHLPVFDWPTRPSWLYRLTQGLHVILGLTLVPIVLAKLWSVLPRLFVWPPARSVAQVLERLTLVLLVGGILFQFATGLLNIQYDYIFGFDFYSAHYYGAWVFIAGFLAHVALKLPLMIRSLRGTSLGAVLQTSRSETRPEPREDSDLVPADPTPATISRRGALTVVGGGAAMVFAMTAGQTLGGPVRRLAFLFPRGRDAGEGPTGFQVNRTAEAAGIEADEVGPFWQLTLHGAADEVLLDRDALLAMPQHSAELPIACVEGWSTVQRWSGVRLRDLAAVAGVPRPTSAGVQSIEKGGAFNSASLLRNQVLDPDSLLALRVNGVDLSLDHGYPARVIVPAMPGVHNTKWVASIRFEGG